MMFTDMVNTVATRLNLTSSDALTRIGVNINDRWKRLATYCGYDTIARVTVTATTAIGSRYLTFGPTPQPIVKIISVFNTNFNPYLVMTQMSFQELRNIVPGVDPALMWAVSTTDWNNVTIFLNAPPATQYVLTADALANLATMSGTMVPAFPENFHMALVYGAMADEYDKMEKTDLANKKETQFDDMVKACNYFIHKSAYLDVVQGKDNFINPWWTQPVTQ